MRTIPNLYTYCITFTPLCQGVDSDFSYYYNRCMGNKMGAPKKAPEDRKGSVVTIRLTASERELLDLAAEGKLSTWARQALLRAARRRIK